MICESMTVRSYQEEYEGEVSGGHASHLVVLLTTVLERLNSLQAKQHTDSYASLDTAC